MVTKAVALVWLVGQRGGLSGPTSVVGQEQRAVKTVSFAVVSRQQERSA